MSWIFVTVVLAEKIVSISLKVTNSVVIVLIFSVVAALLVESEVSPSLTLAPVLVMPDIVEKARVLMSVYPEMVEALTVSASDDKVVFTAVVPLVAV
jgi:hypothetical protein